MRFVRLPVNCAPTRPRACTDGWPLGATPDLIVGCTGGGSHFAGLAFPFLREKLAGGMAPTIRAIEPAACPSLTKGVYAYDFGDTAGMTPLMKMHTQELSDEAVAAALSSLPSVPA